MHITLSPQVRDDALTLSKVGDVLTINSVAYDFTPLPEGGILPSGATNCPYILGEVKRIDGRVTLTLLFPIAHDAPHEACFPEPIIDPVDGPIHLPGASHD